jgi:hypothetical protein
VIGLIKWEFEYGYIFGAVCPAKDKALGLMLPVANTAGMIEHLRLIIAFCLKFFI